MNDKESDLEFGLRQSWIPFNFFRKPWRYHGFCEKEQGFLAWNIFWTALVSVAVASYLSISYVGKAPAFTRGWYENLEAWKMERRSEYSAGASKKNTTTF